MTPSSLPYQHLEDEKENYGNDGDDVVHSDDVCIVMTLYSDDVMYNDVM